MLDPSPLKGSGLLRLLFDAIRDPKRGEAYTGSKVARMSLGDLTEEDVEGLRSGSVTDPPLSHVVALARAFGVEPSYLKDGTGEVQGREAQTCQSRRLRRRSLPRFQSRRMAPFRQAGLLRTRQTRR